METIFRQIDHTHTNIILYHFYNGRFDYVARGPERKINSTLTSS